MLDELLTEITGIDEAVLGLESEKRRIDIQLIDLRSKRENLSAKAASEMVNSGCTMAEACGLKWSVRNLPQKLVITDEKMIPPKFYKEKISKSIDKTLLKSAINNGASVPGAYINNGGITLTAKGMT